MKKSTIQILAVLLVVGTWFIISGRHLFDGKEKPYKTLSIAGQKRVVAVFELRPEWTFRTRLEGPPGEIERWKKLILLGQTDYLQFLDNRTARNMYGRTSIKEDQIESQRSYVKNRFKDLSQELKISRVIMVQDRMTRVCHLLVPVTGPEGEYFTSLEWIRSEWYLVPGLSQEMSWSVANAKEVLEAVEREGLVPVNADDLNRVMRRLPQG